MLNVIILGSRENQYAVQVDKNKMVQRVTGYFIDEGLKNCWGICKAKRHHLILEVAKGGVKGRPFIILPNADKMIRVAKITFCEDPSMTKWLETQINQRKGVLIFHRYVIEALVINARAKGPMILAHEK